MLDKSRGDISRDDIQLVKSHFCNIYIRWVTFHPYSDLILSFDEDRNIKTWKLINNDFTLVKAFKINYNEQFEVHPKTRQIVSCSLSYEFKVWDDEGNCVDTYITQDEGQWKLACHKTLPLVALGCSQSLAILALNKPKV